MNLIIYQDHETGCFKIVYKIEKILLRRLHPGAAVFQQLDQLVYCHFAVNIFLDDFLAAVQRYFSGTTSYITEIGIGHFAWAIDDAPHDGNFDALEMGGGGFDAGRGFL